ncbi:copper chaperone PCu(A)C [Novosphingobium sp. 9]|uniref:copper chaperone PCu(A)C n=1 Tax=Novosphingobium sp. 9 TaxID=2025349 RepID=UPI0021B6608C|nr:copper chaperone PCu(A)C [Novosphingobium sp. 9]
MNMRHHIRAAALVAGTALACLALSGCEKANTPTVEDSAAAHDSASGNPVAVPGPDAKPGISARNGRLILAPVAGNPAAAYFTVRNGGTKTAELVSVHIDGASQAMMHTTDGGTMKMLDEVKLDPGAEVSFAPGKMHVMVFGLPKDTKAGTSVEMTLTFSDGDKLSMPLRVQAMGSGMDPGMAEATGMGGPGDMNGMHH